MGLSLSNWIFIINKEVIAAMFLKPILTRRFYFNCPKLRDSHDTFRTTSGKFFFRFNRL